jgi:hypothetical protein
MRTFNSFMKAQNESWWGGRNKLYDNPEWGAAFTALVKKNNGNEKAAEQELRQIASTPAGQYQLKRMGMTIQTTQPEQNPDNSFGAAKLGGAQMFNQEPGSAKSTNPAGQRKFT